MQSMRHAQRDVVTGARPEVALVQDADGLSALGREWDELLRASDADSPFLTWDWVDAWWRHLRGSRALRLIAVRTDGRLIAIAPLATAPTRLPWVSRLEFVATGNAGSDYLDLIVRRGWEEPALVALADAFASQAVSMRLDHLPVGSQSAALADRMHGAGWTPLPARSGVCPVAVLAGQTWDSYLGTLGSNHRANVRRRLRALEKQFTVRFERVDSDDRRAEVLEWLIRVHNQRWDARGGSTAFPNAACRAFHEEATSRALRTNRLRLHMLYLDDVPVASTYCLAHNHRVYFYQGAFDEQYRQHAVGLVAMALTIRSAIAEGAREFDFLYGVEPYKWLWAREVRLLTRIDLFPAHIGGRLSQRTVEAERALRTLARRILQRKPWSSNARPAGAAC
jgi:CelD/BcsL family acetyltransferase involved in cellulose biosynthesis